MENSQSQPDFGHCWDAGFAKDLRAAKPLILNNDKLGSASGVSDGVMLRILREVIGADCSTGDAKLCKSNQIEAWRDVCIARLDEIEREETGELTDDLKSK